MLNPSFIIVLCLVLIVAIVNIPNLKNKDKFRINLLVDGILNKIILGLLLLVILFENFLLGMLFMLFLVVLHLENSKNSETLEGFTDYYKNVC